MGNLPTTDRPKDFLIQGPALARGNRVLEAVHSLYFLPENYKMIFTVASAHDQVLQDEVMSLLARNALVHRVHFNSQGHVSDAVIVSTTAGKAIHNSVSGDSPEALASAILKISRSFT
jgi:phosphoserine aminotransferase